MKNGLFQKFFNFIVLEKNVLERNYAKNINFDRILGKKL